MANIPSGATLDQWISLCAAGDSRALEELYRATSSAVYAYLLSVLKDTHEAEDLLHETYLNVWTGSGGYRSQGKPMAWILTIGKNLCMRQLRGQNKENAPLEEWKAYTPDSEGMTQEDKWVIRQCMEQLPEEERQIVVLHAVSGFKHRQIAQLLELPLSTVLSKYHRSIKKLKAMF